MIIHRRFIFWIMPEHRHHHSDGDYIQHKGLLLPNAEFLEFPRALAGWFDQVYNLQCL